MSGVDSYVKLGGVLVTFFVVQMVGYQHGLIGLHDPPTDPSAYKAILSGMEHLRRLFTPWGANAWPATPFLCAALLVYMLFFPQIARTSEKGSLGARLNKIVLCLIAVVTVSQICVAAWQPDQAGHLAKQAADALTPIALALSYALTLSVLSLIAFRFLIPSREFVLSPELRTEPWPELIGASLTGWLIFLSYLSSRFDGAFDRPATEKGAALSDALVHVGLMLG